MQTFNSSSDFLTCMQKRFGTANFDRWQVVKKPWYSYVQYPTAGIGQLNFFGMSIGSNNTSRQLTNMPKAGSFGQVHFLLKQIACSLFIADYGLASWAGTDATTLYSDFVNGFIQSGLLEIKVGNRTIVQIPKPFLYAPEAGGTLETYTSGEVYTASTRVGLATLVAGAVTVANTTVTANSRILLTTNTVGGTQGILHYSVNAGVGFTITSNQGADTSTVAWEIVGDTAVSPVSALAAVPRVELANKRHNRYLVDPNIYIEAEQNFEVVLTFPSGSLPVIANGIVNDATNPLYIGIVMDGLLFRPTQ